MWFVPIQLPPSIVIYRWITINEATGALPPSPLAPNTQPELISLLMVNWGRAGRLGMAICWQIRPNWQDVTYPVTLFFFSLSLFYFIFYFFLLFLSFTTILILVIYFLTAYWIAVSVNAPAANGCIHCFPTLFQLGEESRLNNSTLTWLFIICSHKPSMSWNM